MTGEKYQIPKFKYSEAGLVQCLAKEKHPDLGPLSGQPEVCWVLDKEYHVGVGFNSQDPERIEGLMREVLEQFGSRHLAVLPASDSPA